MPTIYNNPWGDMGAAANSMAGALTQAMLMRPQLQLQKMQWEEDLARAAAERELQAQQLGLQGRRVTMEEAESKAKIPNLEADTKVRQAQAAEKEFMNALLSQFRNSVPTNNQPPGYAELATILAASQPAMVGSGTANYRQGLEAQTPEQILSASMNRPYVLEANAGQTVRDMSTGQTLTGQPRVTTGMSMNDRLLLPFSQNISRGLVSQDVMPDQVDALSQQYINALTNVIGKLNSSFPQSATMSPQQNGGPNLPVIRTKEEHAKLAPGTSYIGPDGLVSTKQ